MRVRALALCCAVAVLVTAAQTYTVDCNPEFTDCESEMKKLTEEELEHIKDISNKAKTPMLFITPTTTRTTTTRTTTTRATTTQMITTITTNQPEKVLETDETTTETNKPVVKGRRLNLNVDELSNFASALHNTSHSKLGDLSDVNLDEEDYEPLKPQPPSKEMQDKFFTNLEAPFHPIFNNNNNNNDHDRIRFEEVECKENNLLYKQGEKIVRGCEEMCECSPSGYFECTPRCKHPYIRRGRRLNDPHCFESPVDECCSIIACATGGGHLPPNINMEEIQIPNMNKLPTCVHGNNTYSIGASWYIGCHQKCTCEPNAKVLCVPRCKPLPPSDKCINVPDPSDDCCEIHVCDVSQDAHEELLLEQNYEVPGVPVETRQQTPNVTQRHDISANHNEDHKQMMKKLIDVSKTSTMGSLVLKDPIDSVDILHNNSVQVNLQRPNSSSNAFHLIISDDGGKTFKSIELVYDNLILDLEPGKEYILKTVETGTKYNFTVKHDVSFKSNSTGDGCWSEGKFYSIGEEFHIGCTELCECMGNNVKECAALVCPNHVGLELVSKGCVRWAPTPPVTPPNCCPRTARCLSDGTCHFNGTAIPNWTEVPIALTGCERRCFCENGELDCQDVCSPLPKLPPPTFRCPPTHRPAPVNISEDDCCQHWGCLEKTQIDIFRMIPFIEKITTVPTTTTTLKPITPRTMPYLIPPMVAYLPTPPTTIEPLFITTSTLTPELYQIEYTKSDTVLPKPVNPTTSHKVRTSKVIALNTPTHRRTKLKPSDGRIKPVPVQNIIQTMPPSLVAELDQNVTIVTLDDSYAPIKTIYPERDLPAFKNQQKLLDQINKNILPTALERNPDLPSAFKNQQKLLDQINKNILPTALERNPDLPSAFKNQQKLLDQINKNILPTALERNPDLPYSRQNCSVISLYPLKELSLRPTSTLRLKEYFVDKLQEHPMRTIQNEPIVHQEIPFATTIPTTSLPVISFTTQASITTTAQNYEYMLPPGKLFKLKPYKPKYLRLPQSLPGSRFFTPYVKKYNLLLQESRDEPETNVADQDNSHFKANFTIVSNENDAESTEQDEAIIMRVFNNGTLNAIHKISATPNFQIEDLNNFGPKEAQKGVSKNFGRSAEKDATDVAGNGALTPNPHPHSQQPAFLPTIPPEIHFPEDPNADHENDKEPDPEVPGGRIPAYFGDENRKVVVISLVADSPTSVKMLFGLPPVLVGLRGSVDLRYTDEPDIDISLWNSQVFAPADEVLTTPRLEFRLTGLKPSTVYKIRGKLFLHNLPVEPESEVHTIRTQDLPTVPPPPEEKRREIDSGLTILDANDTTAHVSWRRFTEDELKFIDGIQVRFRPVGTPIYSMTELLHHSRSNAELQDLRPGVRYEASLVLIPPPNTLLELHDPGHVEFNTAPYIDPYNWTVTIEERSVGARAAEITWYGVPVPAERWVRVYRAAHTCGGSRKEHDEFRLATRDVPPSLTLAGLLPESRCRIWLELFLSNGKIKTSNVLEVNTRPIDSKEEVDNMVEASSSVLAAGAPRGDYYSALVTVGVLAALGALTSLLLLLVVLRRHRPHSVSITPVPNAPRESSLPPYDNPAYKLELQQETMDL